MEACIFARMCVVQTNSLYFWTHVNVYKPMCTRIIKRMRAVGTRAQPECLFCGSWLTVLLGRASPSGFGEDCPRAGAAFGAGDAV